MLLVLLSEMQNYGFEQYELHKTDKNGPWFFSLPLLSWDQKDIVYSNPNMHSLYTCTHTQYLSSSPLAILVLNEAFPPIVSPTGSNYCKYAGYILLSQASVGKGGSAKAPHTLSARINQWQGYECQGQGSVVALFSARPAFSHVDSQGITRPECCSS